MAGVGGLSNANWHMFEPSPIETQLAMVDPVRNPRAVALAGGYAAERRMAQEDYGTQLQWMHQQQLAEFAQKTQNDRMTQLANFIKEGATPGAMTALKSAGAVPQGVDTAQLEAAGQAAADAKNMNEAGSGIGRLAQGNVQVGQTQLQRFLPGAVQGPNAQIASAQINAASRVQAANIHAASAANAAGSPAQPTTSMTIEAPGGNIRVNSPRKGAPLTPLQALQAAQIDPNSVIGQRWLRSVGASGGTQLPPAPSSSDAEDVAPFAAAASARPPASLPTNSPLAGPLPGAPQAAAQPAQQSVAALNNALRALARSDPKIGQDLLAGAAKNGGKAAYVNDGGKVAVLGASGTKYPLQ